MAVGGVDPQGLSVYKCPKNTGERRVGVCTCAKCTLGRAQSPGLRGLGSKDPHVGTCWLQEVRQVMSVLWPPFPQLSDGSMRVITE